MEILQGPLFQIDELPQPTETEKTPPAANGNSQNGELFGG
jgi:hypothetical protein